VEPGQRRAGGRRRDIGAGRFMAAPPTDRPASEQRRRSAGPWGRSGAGTAGLRPLIPCR
jgi:hypothetical protein